MSTSTIGLKDLRVFKYANKGYGIRILPSYLAWLATIQGPKELEAVSQGERLLPPPLNLESIATQGREWTKRTIQKYIKLGHENRPFHWPKMHPPVPSASGKPVFSHAMLESYAQVTSEPLGRSCLTGFMLFMRHVALWEEEAAGNIECAQIHCVLSRLIHGLGYTRLYGLLTFMEKALSRKCSMMTLRRESHHVLCTIISHLSFRISYGWDASFRIKGLTDAIDAYNQKELQNAQENSHVNQGQGSTPKMECVARVTYADSVDEILSSAKDVVIPLILTTEFMEFANGLTLKALEEAGPKVDDEDRMRPLIPADHADPEEDESTVYWRLNKALNWQMLDRRIDE